LRQQAGPEWLRNSSAMAVSHWLKERRMLRKFVFALLTFGVVTVGLLADEFRGKVKSVDADKMTVTVANKDGTEKTFTVNKDTKFVKAGKGKGADPTPLPEGLKDKLFTADTPPTVMVTFETKDGKDVASEVKVGGARKGKGKDKN